MNAFEDAVPTLNLKIRVLFIFKTPERFKHRNKLEIKRFLNKPHVGILIRLICFHPASFFTVYLENSQFLDLVSLAPAAKAHVWYIVVKKRGIVQSLLRSSKDTAGVHKRTDQ